MNKTQNQSVSIISEILISVRLVMITMIVCCIAYDALILLFAQFIVPWKAEGSLIMNREEQIVGSELIAQQFTRPEYFWPRPSASGYNASGSGGSNLSPSNPELRMNAMARLRFVDEGKSFVPIPADLVTASGSGLDPDITLEAAQYQAGRIARSRNITIGLVMQTLEDHAFRPGEFLSPEKLINVLNVNRALDEMEIRND